MSIAIVVMPHVVMPHVCIVDTPIQVSPSPPPSPTIYVVRAIRVIIYYNYYYYKIENVNFVHRPAAIVCRIQHIASDFAELRFFLSYYAMHNFQFNVLKG